MNIPYMTSFYAGFEDKESGVPPESVFYAELPEFIPSTVHAAARLVAVIHGAFDAKLEQALDNTQNV